MQGAVRTSVTLLVQYIGNTVIFLVTFFQLCFAVFCGRISARKKLALAGSIQPNSKRANHTSILLSGVSLSPTLQPAKLVLRK